MPRTFAVKLAKPFEVIEFHGKLSQGLIVGVYGFYPREMQHGIKQSRCMSHGEHEAVTVWPDRVFWVKTQKTLPYGVYDRGHGHGGPGMSGVGLLHSVNA